MVTAKRKDSPCRAKNPATCPHHGVPSTGLRSFLGDLKTSIEVRKNVSLLEVSKQPFVANSAADLTSHACSISLTWEGEKPDWWNKYSSNLQNRERLGSSPELLDIITTPDGDVAVVWQDVPAGQHELASVLESGYSMKECVFLSMSTGKRVAFLKITNIDDESFDKSFGNDEFSLFRWAEKSTGLFYGMRSYRIPGVRTYNGYNLSPDETKKTKRNLETMASFAFLQNNFWENNSSLSNI